MNNDRKMLKELVDIGNRWRMTPVVDKDFVAMKNEFDAKLYEAIHYLDKPRPKIICLCGSTKFYEAFQKANYDLTMAGNIVLSVGHYPHQKTVRQRVKIDGCMGEQEAYVNTVVPVEHGETVGCTPEQKVELDKLHFKKIEEADEIFVLNVNGYIGESTTNEVNYALELGKPVRWLEPNMIPQKFC